MTRSATEPPRLDPTPIFELFRGNHATELLTAAVAHLRIFDHLGRGPLSPGALGAATSLAERPVAVLVTALRAFGLLVMRTDGRLDLSDLAREHLVPGGEFDVSNYIGLAADSPGVLE